MGRVLPKMFKGTGVFWLVLCCDKQFQTQLSFQGQIIYGWKSGIKRRDFWEERMWRLPYSYKFSGGLILAPIRAEKLICVKIKPEITRSKEMRESKSAQKYRHFYHEKVRKE